MSPLETYLLEIKSHPAYKELLIRLKHDRPTIPPYNGDNTEQWKTQSGRQQGFDQCLSLLHIKLGE